MDAELESQVRAIVRDEIASLAGKAMRRLQDENFTRSPIHNEATEAAKQVLGHFWGEVLAEYGTGESGEVWVMPADVPTGGGIAADYADSAE